MCLLNENHSQVTFGGDYRGGSQKTVLKTVSNMFSVYIGASRKRSPEYVTSGL
jgi:hypothetical protein